jgi:hypothetical protein
MVGETVSSILRTRKLHTGDTKGRTMEATVKARRW